MPSSPPAWRNATRRSVWRSRPSAFSAGACRRKRAWRRAIASRSIARLPWIRRKPAGGARRRNPERLAAVFLHQLTRARRLLGDLGVLQVVTLAFRVGARDALAALERAQRFLGARAVFALGRRFLLRLRSLIALLLRVFLALAVGGFRAERLLALARRGRGRRRSGGRRLHALRLHTGRRHVAVAHLAIRVDPFILLRQRGAGACDQKAKGGEKSFHT